MIQDDILESAVVNNDLGIEVLNADRNSSDRISNDQDPDIKDWMHVAKDLPSSDFKTVISKERNLHRLGHSDLDDLMFWSVVVLFVF